MTPTILDSDEEELGGIFDPDEDGPNGNDVEMGEFLKFCLNIRYIIVLLEGDGDIGNDDGEEIALDGDGNGVCHIVSIIVYDGLTITDQCRRRGREQARQERQTVYFSFHLCLYLFSTTRESYRQRL